MKFEGAFQYMGNHGIVFNVSQIRGVFMKRWRFGQAD